MSLITHASTTRHTEWGGRCRYIRIVIHPTHQALREAASRFNGDDYSNAAGCFHPAPERFRIDKDGSETRVTDPHWAGTMRLTLKEIDSEIVTHECVHAGLAIYRMDVCTDVRLGTGDNLRREEQLAYIIGDLTAQVSNALWRLEVWPLTDAA